MSNQEKAAWLAEHLMGWRTVLQSPDRFPWWVDDEGILQYPVEYDVREFVPAWQPFQIITQAKMVQSVMRQLGWMLSIDDGLGGVYFVQFRKHQRGKNGLPGGMVAGVASDDSEAVAICTAAGKACKWPFEEEA